MENTVKKVEVTEQFVKDAYAASQELDSLCLGEGTADKDVARNLSIHFIRDTPDGVIHVAGSGYAIEDYP